MPTTIGRGRRILVVEDDAERVASLGQVLEAIGYAVTFASGIDAAIKLARVRPPHFILGSSDLAATDRDELRRRIWLDPDLRDVPVGFLAS